MTYDIQGILPVGSADIYSREQSGSEWVIVEGGDRWCLLRHGFGAHPPYAQGFGGQGGCAKEFIVWAPKTGLLAAGPGEDKIL